MSDWPEVRRLLAGDALDVAPRLLGGLLTVHGVTLRLTEVEAYEGSRDPGSHAFRGRTARNATMFGPPGHLYCYRIYGLHTCANVVCGGEGVASALLLRAAEVVDGVGLAQERRGEHVAAHALARGPGNLVRCLGLDVTDDGLDLEGALELAPSPAPDEVRTGPRVGLRAAAELPWRFWLAGEATVSAYRPAVPRKPRRPPHPL